MRILAVISCLVACCLFSSSLSFAQTSSQLPPAVPEETVELQSLTLIDSRLPTTTTVDDTQPSADSTQPSADSQANGKGSGSATKRTKVTGSPTGAPASTAYVFPTDREMGAYWVRNVLGSKAFIGATVNASWNTWVHLTPDEWGHRRGWGKRFGVSLLDNSMNESARVLLSLAMNQDPMYYRCDCSGAWARTKHAIKMSFMSRNHSGDSVFAPPKIVAPFVGPLVTRNTIYPSRFDSSNAASSGAYYLVGSVGWNIVREFIWNMRK